VGVIRQKGKRIGCKKKVSNRMKAKKGKRRKMGSLMEEKISPPGEKLEKRRKTPGKKGQDKGR